MIEMSITNEIIQMDVASEPLILSVANEQIQIEISNDTIVYSVDENAYIPKDIITAKGDMVIGSAAETPAVLSTNGFNGYFAVADSTQDKGLKLTNQIDGGTF